MNRLKYNKIFDKVDLYEGLEKDTLTIRLEGNIGEDCPSDMHRYDISFPAEVGEYTVDFSFYFPKHKYELIIKSVNKNSVDITFNGNDYTLSKKRRFFSRREYLKGRTTDRGLSPLTKSRLYIQAIYTKEKEEQDVQNKP